MPRIVDHEERRRQLTEAVWSLVRESGLKAVTIRAVAARSGWSSGTIRHYLPTHDAILEFAARQIELTATDHVAQLPIDFDNGEQLADMLASFLPITDEYRGYLQVWMAFMGQSVSQSDEPDALLTRPYREYLRSVLASFAARGAMAPEDVDTATTELHGLLIGLIVHMLVLTLDAEQARAALIRWTSSNLTTPAPSAN